MLFFITDTPLSPPVILKRDIIKDGTFSGGMLNRLLVVGWGSAAMGQTLLHNYQFSTNDS